MKRNYYPNDKLWPTRQNSKSSKEKRETQERPTRICCMECGSSHGTLRKIKKADGSRGYLCEYCFNAYKDNDEE